MDALVTTDWLAAHLRDPDLRVVDGTWHMPQLKRDPRAEFAQAHIPGAVFFDIDAIADHATTLPHMLPSAQAFKILARVTLKRSFYTQSAAQTNIPAGCPT